MNTPNPVAPLDLAASREAAQAVMGERLDHIDRIVTAQNQHADAAQRTAAARAEEAESAAAVTAALRAALDAGWTTTELRKVGLTVPHDVARRATPTRRSTRPRTAGRERPVVADPPSPDDDTAATPAPVATTAAAVSGTGTAGASA